ncbi:hypothetical protein EGW08_002560, partial [Elysia chlorotica]
SITRLTFPVTYDPAFLGGHVTAVGPRVGEALGARGALERFLSRVNANVLWWWKVMLEFECLAALRALELPQVGRLGVADHVTLQAIHIGKRFLTHLVERSQNKNQRSAKMQGQVLVQVRLKQERLLTPRALVARGLAGVSRTHVVAQETGPGEHALSIARWAVDTLQAVLLL